MTRLALLAALLLSTSICQADPVAADSSKEAINAPAPSTDASPEHAKAIAKRKVAVKTCKGDCSVQKGKCSKKGTTQAVCDRQYDSCISYCAHGNQ